MNEKDFCYWLNGYIELNGELPSPQQWEMIKEHLKLVFNKVTPPPKPPSLRQIKEGVEIVGLC